ncbi:cyclohexanone monooxygenase [Reticulibacter mediterranei]|uniref:Cyclohexanone monooxygenase n=1 Tax=Reticulibacter mediterranei TaxID=2778369 RepID=A0A8J3N9W8_9CHLR|nr:NAD(P)/FAD-dependent oxidoreductase [Reticulibacter mediterranei]GHO99767.1 cyclohexanone monooxygenase [Reticulibacter mediterranei]
MSTGQHSSSTPGGVPISQLDVVVVGAGFSGLYMLYRLRELGLSTRVFEAGEGVGGTWYWNRYPGARCDSPSVHYSYSFSPELEQEWEWTEKYPTQPEILRYLNHVADRFDLCRNIQFNTRVVAASYDDVMKRWTIQTDRGERMSARYLITAVGCLSTPNAPRFNGLDSFKGEVYHTGRWPHEGVDLTGKRIGVIGTGSTGIQAIPRIARQAAHVTVFQRTPNYSIPARNRPLEPEEKASIKENYRRLRQMDRESPAGLSISYNPQSALAVSPEERQRRFEEVWQIGGTQMLGAFSDIVVNLEANTYMADFVRAKIGEMVHNPEVAKKLMPHDHPIGTKRICIDTEYYETYNRENVSLVDVRTSPIQEITPKGLRTQDAEYELDVIVFATGFDAMTGSLFNLNIRGKNGEALKEKWATGPRTYLGLMSAGFPNLFMITGPGSPSVLSNMTTSIEQHVEWITDCIRYMQEHHFSQLEPKMEAEDAWVAHVNEVANQTLYPLANSWYLGANIPGKVRIFMPYVGGVGNYRIKCQEIADEGYKGFTLSA